jgi:TP901 family phage tail tape measure protein
MAGSRIKGITIEIDGSTTGLQKALSSVNTQTYKLQSELRDTERLLKFNPGNTELLAQKQRILAAQVETTKNKLNQLKDAQVQVNRQFAEGKISDAQYRGFQRELTSTESKLKDVEGQLKVADRELNANGTAAKQLARDYKKSFDDAKQSSNNAFDSMKNVGAGATAAGAGIAAGFGFAVKSAADFDQAMANAYAVMDPKDVNKFKGSLKDLAVELGAKTQFSAKEAAQGIGELLKAGVSVTDIIHGGLKGALSLAAAGDLSLADSAEIASTALNAFHKDGLSVTQAANILAGAANASATDVGELKYSLSMVSAVASGVGLSFKDTSTALAVFAQSGLKGSDAGTSLKTMLSRLEPQTDKAAAQFEDLGLMTFDASKAAEVLSSHGVKPLSKNQGDLISQLTQLSVKMSGAKEGSKAQQKAYKDLTEKSGALHSAFYDNNGDLKNMSDIAQLLQTHLGKLSSEQRQQALYTMFGSDAIRGANILFEAGAKGVDNMANSMSKVTAAQTAATKMNTFKGAIELMKGSAETAAQTIGDALLPALKLIVKALQGLIDWFNKLSKPMKSFIAIGAALTAALLLIIGPILLLIGMLPAIAAGFTMLSGPVGAIVGIVAIVAVAIGAFIAILRNLWKTNADFRSNVMTIWKSIQKIFASVMPAITVIIKVAWALIRSIIVSTLQAVQNVISGAVKVIANIFKLFGSLLTGNWKGVWSAIKGILSGALQFLWGAINLYFVGKLLAPLRAFGPFAKGILQGIWSAIKGIFTGGLGSIRSSVSGGFNFISSLISRVMGAVRSVISSVWSLIRGNVSGVVSGIRGAVSSAFNAIRNVVSSVMSGVWSAVRNGWSRAIGFLRGISLVSIGRNIIQGLVSGIKSAFGAVKNIIGSISNAIPDGVKKLLHIHSPSRVMRDEVGRFIPLGLADGISQSLGVVKRASQAMAAAAIPDIGKLNVSAGVSGSQAASTGSAGGFSQTLVINSPKALSPAEIARKNLQASRRMAQQWGLT